MADVVHHSEPLPRCSAGPGQVPRRAYLDGWRGLAVLLVTIGHFAPFPTGKLAGTGVELFFVLSGRLMADLLIEQHQALPTFFVRRMSRILPTLLIYVMTILILEAAIALANGEPIPLIGAAGAIGFFTNYLPSMQVDHLFEHCWSLAVEEHGYVTLALVAWLTGRRRRPALALVAGLTILAAVNGSRLLHDPSALGHYAYWRSDVRTASISWASACGFGRCGTSHGRARDCGNICRQSASCRGSQCISTRRCRNMGDSRLARCCLRWPSIRWTMRRSRDAYSNGAVLPHWG